MESLTQNNGNSQNKRALEEIAKAIRALKYGQLNITIHQGRIMQIDVVEKLRFDKLPLHENGNGI